MRCTGIMRRAAVGAGAGWFSVRARCVRRCTRSARPLRSSLPSMMADWSLLDREWLPAPPPAPYDPYQYSDFDPYYQEKPQQQPPSQPPLPPPAQQSHPYFSPPSPSLTLLLASPRRPPPTPAPMSMLLPMPYMPFPKGENPREIRNKAEKQRRDKLNHSIAELASMVPPVVAASRKIDKTGVLRLTAHYLRSHQYVFGDSINQATQFKPSSTRALLKLLNGFLLTITYKGLIVVVSENVNEYLGYTEMDLLGQNIFTLTHEDDRQMLKDQLMPRSQKLGTNGELLVPEEGKERQRVAQALANEKRRFSVRFKKLGQRSEPTKYITCHVEGSLRKSDRACRGYNRCCQMVRRARARGDNPCSSGNDVVFIGVVRPTMETFINESAMESYNMEYRTRHSIDGEIIQCDQRIALVTGYMTHEVNGVNAMNFIHRDEVRWVIVTLRDMYEHNLLCGESCYRLMTKNGQFIYLRTRGRLDVDKGSRAVTSFVCTNTVVEEKEGKHLIRMMKEKFTLSDNNNDSELSGEDNRDIADNQAVSVEDPRELKKEILSLVTNLPSPDSSPPTSAMLPGMRLAIIPPKKERIVSAIEKIYTVIKSIQPSNRHEDSIPDGGYALSPNPNDFLQPQMPADLPFDQVYLQRQCSSVTEPTYSPATSSQLEYLPVGMAYDETMPFNYNGAQMKFQMFPPQESFSEQLFSETIQPGPSVTGMKRHKHFDERQESSTKKKVTSSFHELNADEQTSGRNSPSLETFFDEAILNTQIESAIDSLEHTIDPSFPDLLISNEVQDILGKIEGRDEDI